MTSPSPDNTERVLQNGIRLHRHGRALLQREVASQLGIPQQCLSLYERGKREPDLIRAMEFAIALGTTVERLFHEHYLLASERVADRDIR